MEDESKVANPDRQEAEQHAAHSARARASMGRWDLNIAVFLFAVMIIVIILLFQGVGIEIVSPVAAVGLALVWVTGWRRGKQLYQLFYDEELKKIEKSVENPAEKSVEETIEEKVQRALRDRT